MSTSFFVRWKSDYKEVENQDECKLIFYFLQANRNKNSSLILIKHCPISSVEMKSKILDTEQFIAFPTFQPSEDFGLTASSLEALIETHRKLILRTLRYLTVNSQDELTL